MIDAAKNKLYLLGATPQQVEKLITAKEPQINFSIYSAYDGYVISESQQAPVAAVSSNPPSSSGMGGGMDGSMSSTPSPSQTQPMNTSAEFVREGAYVTTGQVLFKVVNANAMRVELNLPASQAKQVSIGTAAELTFDSQKTQKGKVDFIQPFFTDGQEFITIRIYVKDNSLQVGQFLKASLESSPIEGLWIPKEAVLDLGDEKVVFIKEREIFKPKIILTGIQSDGWIEIKSGLSSSDEVAVDAQYLIDSESFVKTK